jgi:hypothetical protein
MKVQMQGSRERAHSLFLYKIKFHSDIPDREHGAFCPVAHFIGTSLNKPYMINGQL